jgi:hypothetical protein
VGGVVGWLLLSRIVATSCYVSESSMMRLVLLQNYIP